MGGTAQTGKRAQKKAISYLNEEPRNFPTEWVERSNTHGNPWFPKMSTRRAHATSRTAEPGRADRSAHYERGKLL